MMNTDAIKGPADAQADAFFGAVQRYVDHRLGPLQKRLDELEHDADASAASIESVAASIESVAALIGSAEWKINVLKEAILKITDAIADIRRQRSMNR